MSDANGSAGGNSDVSDGPKYRKLNTKPVYRDLLLEMSNTREFSRASWFPWDSLGMRTMCLRPNGT